MQRARNDFERQNAYPQNDAGHFLDHQDADHIQVIPSEKIYSFRSNKDQLAWGSEITCRIAASFYLSIEQ